MQSALVASPVGQKAGVFGTQVRKPVNLPARALRAPVLTRAAAIAAEDVPDMSKRVMLCLSLEGLGYV